MEHTIETLSGDVSVRSAAGLRVEARTVSGDLSVEAYAVDADGHRLGKKVVTRTVKIS